MPAVAASPTRITEAGHLVTLGAFNTDGYTIANDEQVFAEILASGAATVTLTATRNGATITDTVTFTNGQRKLVGRWDMATFGSAITMTADTPANLTIAFFK